MNYIIYPILILTIFFIFNVPKIANKLIIWRWMSKLSIAHHQFIFNKLFENVNGFALSKISRKTNDAPEYTYGEISFVPFIALLSQTNINKNSVFYDLGSGVGKAVLACSMVFKVKKSTGVELFANLYECAQNQIIHLKNYPEYKNNKINFVNDNFLNVELADATLIFINATGFIGETWNKLNDKLERLQKPLTIISISKKIKAKNFKIIKKTYVEMSWGVAVAYIYAQ